MSRSNNSRKGSRTRHKSSMNHKKIGKYSVGVGGLDCDCCIKGKDHKAKQRKWERHVDNHNLRNDLGKNND